MGLKSSLLWFPLVLVQIYVSNIKIKSKLAKYIQHLTIVLSIQKEIGC